MVTLIFLRLSKLFWLLILGCNAQFGQPDFWDRFPDIWRGLGNIRPGFANQAHDIQRQSRFDEWKNSSRKIPDTGSQSFYDTIHNLFSSAHDTTTDGNLRNAMISLGAIGTMQPQAGRGQFSFSSLFPEFRAPAASRDWWNGPNVCVERKEENLLANITLDKSGADSTNRDGDFFGHSMHINSCSHSNAHDNDAYTCATEIKKPNFHRKYLVKYHCCYGFIRENKGYGCTKTIPMTNLMETLDNLKLTQFKKFVQDFGLHTYLEGSNITVFAPTNEAFDDYSSMSNEITSSKPNDFRTVIQSHIASGLIRSSDFIDEEIINTLSQSAIRINLFATPDHVLTADCARVVSLNNLAKNGVVHIVDKVIQPVLMNLEAALRADGRFNTLLQLLSDAGLLDLLRDAKGHMTILAPTDDAFRLLERNVRNRLSEDSACLKRVLQNHILPNVICSAVIERTAMTTNIINKVIRFDRDIGHLTAQNQTIISPDNMATNGMYHVLDGLIIPEEARNLQQIAADAGLDAYMALVKETGFGSTLDQMHNVTLFVPSDRAFHRQSQDTQQQLASAAVDVLKYHAVQPAVLLSNFKDNLEMQSAFDGNKLRMNVYETFPFGRNVITVNCVKISVANLRGCDGTIHVLEKILTMPSGNVLDTLLKGNFSKFLGAVESASLTSVLTARGPVTAFAPTNSAFDALQPDEQQQLFSNTTLLKSVIQLHLFPRQICCAGIMEDSMFFGQYSRSLNPTYSLPLHRTRYGQIKIAGSNVQKCDIIASNGIIHSIDKVIFPKNFL